MSRTRNLQAWIDKGLWPLRGDELLEATKKYQAKVQRAQAFLGAMIPTTNDDQQDATEELKSEPYAFIRSLLAGIELTNRDVRTGVGKFKTGNQRLEMLSVRLPRDVIQSLRALEGNQAQHVERALRHYISVMQAERDADDTDDSAGAEQ